MTDLELGFSQSPYWLWLLIPAIGIPLLIYFCSAKKYRRTRSRIISLVLHTLIMALAVFLLAGMTFFYQVPNRDNEILLLVDVSDSTAVTSERKDEFIRSAIERKSPAMKMGIIAFGCNQVYAAPLSYEGEGLYEAYLEGKQDVDASATNYESALLYASRIFEHPSSAKIVLISDGEETDGSARSIIKSVASQGIKVDTVFMSEMRTDAEVRIVGMSYPEETPVIDKEFSLTLELESNYAGNVELTICDNGTETTSKTLSLLTGRQTVTIPYTFSERGLHCLEAVITTEESRDVLNQNNLCYSYCYIDEFDNILVIERERGESEDFVRILQQAEYETDVVTVLDSEKMPDSVKELRQYDEVVLFNIANADMPLGFDELLHSYTYDYGGNVLTVGGKTESGEANVYNREDMYGTLYQEMLPVEAIEYTPPIAVVFIIDRSGSMSGNKLELAKDGAIQSLQALTTRDWVGVMTLETEYNDELALTPVPQLSEIEAAIDSIEPGGSTNYTSAIEHAGAALSILDKVQKRHIIIISDGQPGDSLWENEIDQTGGYGGAIRDNYEKHGITCSIVSISEGWMADVETAVTYGHGKFYHEENMSNLSKTLTEDLRETSVQESNEENFVPRIHDLTSVVNGINQQEIPALGGYYGTRIKDGAVQPLVTPYGDVPIYAQWSYGKGKVGSFLSDLSGAWAQDFIVSETGQKILLNMIEALYPTENIHPQDVSMTLNEQNYETGVNIFGIGEEESARISVEFLGRAEDPGSEDPGAAGVVSAASDDAQNEVQIVQPTQTDFYSSASFTVRMPGLYKITLEKLDAEGNVIASCVDYKAFSCSAEYDYFPDDQAEDGLGTLAIDGGGTAIQTAGEIFDSLVRSYRRSFDPRVLFSSLIIVMFLLDVAVRKFKFKWLHEIVRDRRLKKSLAQGKGAQQEFIQTSGGK